MKFFAFFVIGTVCAICSLCSKTKLVNQVITAAVNRSNESHEQSKLRLSDALAAADSHPDCEEAHMEVFRARKVFNATEKLSTSIKLGAENLRTLDGMLAKTLDYEHRMCETIRRTEDLRQSNVEVLRKYNAEVVRTLEGVQECGRLMRQLIVDSCVRC
jgi:hypothetical protein